jgi:hypothetical protein
MEGPRIEDHLPIWMYKVIEVHNHLIEVLKFEKTHTSCQLIPIGNIEMKIYVLGLP